MSEALRREDLQIDTCMQKVLGQRKILLCTEEIRFARDHECIWIRIIMYVRDLLRALTI
jgi:hypothetical protein